MLKIFLLTTVGLFSCSTMANACVNFTGVYRFEGQAELSPVSLNQHGCENLELRYDDKTLPFILMGKVELSLGRCCFQSCKPAVSMNI